MSKITINKHVRRGEDGVRSGEIYVGKKDGSVVAVGVHGETARVNSTFSPENGNLAGGKVRELLEKGQKISEKKGDGDTSELLRIAEDNYHEYTNRGRVK